MGFMERITERKCRLKEFIDRYQGEPLVVLGAGGGSRGIIRYLAERGIEGFRVCVDDDHWAEGAIAEGGHPVERLSDVLAGAEGPYDVIVAYSTFKRESLDPYAKRYPGTIGRVAFYDIFPHFWMSPQIFSVDREYYESKDALLTKVYEDLGDDLSRKAMVSFVEQRISGDFRYSDGVVSDWEERYYDSDLIPFDRDITLIDCGAYDGEDTRNFFHRYGGDLRAFVLEPDAGNMEEARKSLAPYGESVRFLNKAALDSERTVSFSGGGGEGSGISDHGGSEVEAIRIDKIVEQHLEDFAGRDSILKMDIEGAERQAIIGARGFLSGQNGRGGVKRPALAICAYHKPEDVFEIPLCVKELCPDYKLYMRRYDVGFRDLVLYAIP